MELRKSDTTSTPTRRTARTPSDAVLLTIACGLLGSTLVLHYPARGWTAAMLLGACALAAFARRDLWLIALPALLPIVAFAPWTGWITFEELDLLVLAVAAGGYARQALSLAQSATAGPVRPERVRGAGALACMAAFLFAASVLVAMARGFADAGGFVFGWFQGFNEPLNTLRLAKPFFMTLLLWPLWRVASTDAPQISRARLSFGLMTGPVEAVFVVTVFVFRHPLCAKFKQLQSAQSKRNVDRSAAEPHDR